jgi:hypothetical protein
VTDGWILCHVALAAVRELEAQAWIKSFTKVNLHPHHRVSFEQWCERIAGHLQGGLSFKSETDIDAYAMLPSWWHGMLPEEKKLAMTIFEKHDSSFTVACVKELSETVHVPMADMQNMRVCLDLAIEDSSHLERSGAPQKAAVVKPTEVAAVSAGLKDVNEGLRSFQLHPKKRDGTQLLSGYAKFEHLCKVTRRSTPEGTTLAPSRYLDVEFSATQQRLLDPSSTDFMMHAIASTVTGEGAKQSLAKRKLDALGNVRGTCCFANDPQRLKRLRGQLELAESLAEINKQKTDERATLKSTATAALVEKAPEAVAKITSGKAAGDFQKMTMPEMKAIAFVKFNGKLLVGDKVRVHPRPTAPHCTLRRVSPLCGCDIG